MDCTVSMVASHVNSDRTSKMGRVPFLQSNVVLVLEIQKTNKEN